MGFNSESLPSPYYRVAIKAIVFNEANKILVVQNEDGDWEIPGGGWEHSESFRDCLEREIDEELGAHVETASGIAITYQGINPRGYVALRLVTVVTLEGSDFSYGDGMLAAQFVGPAELDALPMVADDTPIKALSAEIWRLSPSAQ